MFAIAISVSAGLACPGENGGPAPAVDPTPPMPDTLEDMSKDQFEAHVASLAFDTDPAHGKHAVARKCRRETDGSCDPSNSAHNVSVDIIPHIGSHLLRKSGLDDRGHLVAQIVNNGPRREGRYALPGNRTSYMIIFRDSVRFVYVRGNDVRVASTSTYRECGDGGQTHPEPDRTASFQQCLALAPTVPASPGVLTGDEPAWLSCVAGCCIAENEISAELMPDASGIAPPAGSPAPPTNR